MAVYLTGNCKGFGHWTHSGWGQGNLSETYKGYTENFICSGYSYCTKTEADFALKAAVQDWKNSIDAQEKQSQKKNISPMDPDTPAPKGDYQKFYDELQELKKDIKKTPAEKTKDMKKIISEIEAKNEAKVAELDKGIEQLQEEKINIAQSIKEAREKGRKEQEKLLVTKMKELDTKIGEKLVEKGGMITKDEVLQLFESYDKPWYQKINWKNPWFYGKTILSLGLIFVVYLIFMWIWKKIRTLFFSNN